MALAPCTYIYANFPMLFLSLHIYIISTHMPLFYFYVYLFPYIRTHTTIYVSSYGSRKNKKNIKKTSTTERKLTLSTLYTPILLLILRHIYRRCWRRK